MEHDRTLLNEGTFCVPKDLLRRMYHIIIHQKDNRLHEFRFLQTGCTSRVFPTVE